MPWSLKTCDHATFALTRSAMSTPRSTERLAVVLPTAGPKTRLSSACDAAVAAARRTPRWPC